MFYHCRNVLFTGNSESDRAFPKIRGDAEHPKVIPMDPSSPHQVPKGPMTRARARALETEVTSLLALNPSDIHETWLLPSSGTLCILRYLDEGHGTALHNGQDGEFDKCREQEEGRLKMLQAPDVRPTPDDRRLPGTGRPEDTGRPASPRRPDDRKPSNVRDTDHRTK